VGSFHVVDRVDEEGLQRVVRRARHPPHTDTKRPQHARSGCRIHLSMAWTLSMA